MKAVCIIQARMGSKRLPGKVHMDIGGKPMIWHVEERVKAAAQLRYYPGPEFQTVVAWPDPAYEDENDVLGRYYRKATELGADAVIRVTGDCPLIAPEAITDVLDSFYTLYRTHPYVANDIYPTYPDGIGVECFSYDILEYAHYNARGHGREHVTTFLKSDKTIGKANLRCPINGISDLKLSVDTQKDLDFVRAIDAAGPRDFSLVATLEAIRRVQNQD